jgi:hypothetical protein
MTSPDWLHRMCREKVEKQQENEAAYNQSQFDFVLMTRRK